MPGYKPQVKSESGEMVDIPIAATYDENGNRLTEQYVSTIAQTFTDEEKAQARKNIGAASESAAGGRKYLHQIGLFVKENSANSAYYNAVVSFYAILDDEKPVTAKTMGKRLGNGSIFPCIGGFYSTSNTAAPQTASFVRLTDSNNYFYIHSSGGNGPLYYPTENIKSFYDWVVEL